MSVGGSVGEASSLDKLWARTSVNRKLHQPLT